MLKMCNYYYYFYIVSLKTSRFSIDICTSAYIFFLSFPRSFCNLGVMQLGCNVPVLQCQTYFHLWFRFMQLVKKDTFLCLTTSSVLRGSNCTNLKIYTLQERRIGADWIHLFKLIKQRGWMLGIWILMLIKRVWAKVWTYISQN